MRSLTEPPPRTGATGYNGGRRASEPADPSDDLRPDQPAADRHLGGQRRRLLLADLADPGLGPGDRGARGAGDRGSRAPFAPPLILAGATAPAVARPVGRAVAAHLGRRRRLRR